MAGMFSLFLGSWKIVFLVHIKFFKDFFFFKLKILSDYAAFIGFQLINLHDLLYSAFQVVETTVMCQNTWLDQGDLKKIRDFSFSGFLNWRFLWGGGVGGGR